MKVTLQLIQLVKHPKSKNNWLAVNDYPQLKHHFPSLIQDYDFVDFEGRIFYYNMLSQYKLDVDSLYLENNQNSKIIVSKKELIELLDVTTVFSKQVIIKRFIENETVVLLRF